MAGYTELIKSFDKIRNFTREFFIYGYKGRGDFTGLSPRSYDNERRRLESYLGDLVLKKSDNRGKTISISSNTIAKTSNPLFKLWRTKSFTRKDCFLHFVILDILTNGKRFNVTDITEIISNEYTSKLAVHETIDPMTIRNKLKEYVDLGILQSEKSGKAIYYFLSEDPLKMISTGIMDKLETALSFYKNVAPGGFIGQSIIDKENGPFIYRQIFFSQTLEDEISLQILGAIQKKRVITLNMHDRKKNTWSRNTILVPLKVLNNTKTGRQYVAIYNTRTNKYSTVRLDYIKDVCIGDLHTEYHTVLEDYQFRMRHSFSITHQSTERLHSFKMTLHIDEENEQYVLERLKREGRGGLISKIAPNTFEYQIDVADILEMVPWLRTFIGRIIELEGSESHVISQFKEDIHSMLTMYMD